MAIPTGAPIDFFGTPATVTVAGGTSAVADGAYSVAGDVVAGGWTNADDAISASMVLSATFAVAPTARTVVNLFARPLAIDGANDGSQPDANYAGIYVGSFLVDPVTSAQSVSREIPLMNTKSQQVWEFYVNNETGQSLPAGWTLKITPKSVGPKA